MQIRQPNTLERETRSSLVDIFDAHHAGPLVIGDQQYDDLVQKFFLHKSENLVFEKIIKPIISRSLYEVEGRAAGSAELLLRLLKMSQDPKERIVLKQIDWNKIDHKIKRFSKIKPTRSEISNFLEKKCQTKIKSLIENALDAALREDSIVVSRSYSTDTKLTLEPGYTFTDLKIDRNYFYPKSWNNSDVEIILVDGIIEKVVHVESILNISNKEKKPFIIICREASDEVKNACIVNFMRKTANVVLCTAPYSEKTAHILNDITEITGCSQISPELGDVITTLIFKKSKNAGRIRIENSNITFLDCASENIRKYREDLIFKMNSINDNDITDLIRRRLKMLTGRKVIINIGDDIVMKNRNAVEQIDKVLRQMKDSMTSGIITNIEEFSFLDEQDVNRSTLSVKVSSEAFRSLEKIFNEVGLILLED